MSNLALKPTITTYKSIVHPPIPINKKIYLSRASSRWELIKMHKIKFPFSNLTIIKFNKKSPYKIPETSWKSLSHSVPSISLSKIIHLLPLLNKTWFPCYKNLRIKIWLTKDLNLWIWVLRMEMTCLSLSRSFNLNNNNQE